MPFRVDRTLIRAHWYKISHNWPKDAVPAHRTHDDKVALHGIHSPTGPPVCRVQQDCLDSDLALAKLLSQLKLAGGGGNGGSGDGGSSDSDDEAPVSKRLKQGGGKPLWPRAKMPLSEFIVPDECSD